MIGKFKDMWKQLAFRMLCVVCMTFLPLNIMAIIVSGLVIGKSSEQIAALYQWELDSAMERFSTEIGKIEDKVDRFVLEYQGDLMIANDSDNMVSYEMLGYLGTIVMESDLRGFFYLYDSQANHLYLKYSNQVYTLSRIEELKAQLLEQGIPDGTNVSWQIYSLGTNYFYLKNYEYMNYKMGFFMDLDTGLGEIIGEGFVQERDLYFTDGSTIIESVDGEIIEIDSGSWEELFKNTFFYQSVQYQSDSLGCMIGLQMARVQFLESIPILYWILLVTALFCVLLIFALYGLLQKRVVQPLKQLQEGMEQLKKENFKYRIQDWGEEETQDFVFLYESFNHMAEEIRKSHEKDLMVFQVQLNNLKLQVSPHMLLNSFNMIYSLAQTKNYECIQEFSIHLVDYFRYVLKEMDQFVTVKREMKFVESYIGIQKIRFPGAFTSVYSIEEGAEKALIPPLLIENFVENSMKYALVPGTSIEILINIRRDGDRLLISICDTGNGMKEEVLQVINKGEVLKDKMGQKHIGIWNCRKRLAIFYEKNASIHIMSTYGEGTQVWLDLPFVETDYISRKE
ncbi:histidine kinase [Lachnospiraceae bacterium OttesenSCG-928-D06]|nr:histidine kinase [Lachnospiraceae bacterium OttesenSCG-928-D06]